jgi:hypothetical protein
MQVQSVVYGCLDNRKAILPYRLGLGFLTVWAPFYYSTNAASQKGMRLQYHYHRWHDQPAVTRGETLA